jgi:hypothetical protein
VVAENEVRPLDIDVANGKITALEPDLSVTTHAEVNAAGVICSIAIGKVPTSAGRCGARRSGPFARPDHFPGR